jgi:hypothetical protein
MYSKLAPFFPSIDTIPGALAPVLGFIVDPLGILLPKQRTIGHSPLTLKACKEAKTTLVF